MSYFSRSYLYNHPSIWDQLSEICERIASHKLFKEKTNNFINYRLITLIAVSFHHFYSSICCEFSSVHYVSTYINGQ